MTALISSAGYNVWITYNEEKSAYCDIPATSKAKMLIQEGWNINTLNDTGRSYVSSLAFKKKTKPIMIIPSKLHCKLYANRKH